MEKNFEILSFVAESSYVWDLPQNRFHYIKPDDLFLCNYPVEEALKEGDDFYRRIIHPEDLPLWIEMCEAAIRYLEDRAENPGEIDHFISSVRLQREYSFRPGHPLPQMIYHRTAPYWKDNELRYLICSVRISMEKEASLRAYHKNGSTYDKYNLITRRWKTETKISLTEREKAILMLAAQGKNKNEIAEELDREASTIQNQCKEILSKLKVNSMQKAVRYAYHHHLMI